MYHILIVEDEYKIARFVALELEHEGYKTTVISDGGAELGTASLGFNLSNTWYCLSTRSVTYC